MEINKETVKAWLNRHNRDREWLASQCEVNKRTVDNWLVSPRDIPTKAVRIIETLMASDSKIEEAKRNLPQNLVLELSEEDFAQINKASMAKGQTIKDWSVAALNQLASQSLDQTIQELSPTKESSNENGLPSLDLPGVERKGYRGKEGKGTRKEAPAKKKRIS